VRSHAKAPSAGSVWIAATALVLSLLLLALSCAPAFAVQGRPYLETLRLTPGSEPKSIATDGAGNLYIENDLYTPNDELAQGIEKFDGAGNPINWGASGSYVIGNKLTGTPAGPFRSLDPNGYGIGGLAVDDSGGPANGSIYAVTNKAYDAAGTSKGGIFAFDSGGTYKGFIPADRGLLISVKESYACGIGVNHSDGSLFLAGLYLPGASLFTPTDGNPAHISFSGQISATRACATAIDSTGATYLEFPEAGLIKKFDSSQIGAPFPSSTQINSDGALAVDLDDDSLIVDQGDRALEFDSSGNKVGEIAGLFGSQGVAFGGGGKLYLTQRNASVLVFGRTPVQLPMAETDPAPVESPVAATLSGTVDPDGAGSIIGCEFRYGVDRTYSTGALPCDNALPITGPAAVTASAAIDPATTYHFQLMVRNANGVQLGSDQTFTTPPAVEGVATGDATDVTRTTATLHGAFIGRGESNAYYFEYGTDTNYGQSAPASPTGVGSSSGEQEIPSTAVANLAGGTEYHYRLVMTNAFGKTVGEDRAFTTPPAVTNLTAEAATGITNNSAELHGSFEADQYETHYYFEWGATTNYGNTAPLPPGTAIPAGSGKVDLPAVTISGLKQGGNFHYRVVATNATGKTISADALVSTADAPSVANLNSRNVLSTSAELTGEVDPNLSSTSYRFEWGPTAAYGNVSPSPDGNVGPGQIPVAVSTALENLSPEVTYHFRLVATNAYGTTASSDQTFGFRPSTCPNAQVRQETRSNSLPDCRAYELVSPSFAQGTFIYPERGPTSPFATSPSAVAYTGSYGTFPEETGDAHNVLADLYVSTRSDSGWFQKFIGKSPSENFAMGGPPGNKIENFAQAQTTQLLYTGTQASPDFSKVVTYDLGWPSNNFGQLSKSASNAPYIWNSSTGQLSGRWPSNLSQVPDGEKFVGWPRASDDFSHFVFQSNLVFAPGGSEVSREIECCANNGVKGLPPASVYDNDLTRGDVGLASIRGDDKTPFQGYVFDISDDGSQILMSEKRASPDNAYTVVEWLNDVPGPLYLRANGEHTYEIAPGRQITYVGSSGDGKTVYLRSAERLTPDDKDNSTDLYVWRESTEELTRVSVGDEGEIGNRDSCSAGWNGGGCNIEVFDRSASYAGYENGVDPTGIGNRHSDDAVAAANGDIYFISPEQLVTGKGVDNRANLYLYRNETVRFVATLNEEPFSVTRMQVTPDGKHVSFVTRANVTGYDSGGHREMYIYEPDSGYLACASCRPDGQVPNSDVRASKNGLFQAYDGRVFFATDDSLVPRDTNNGEDIYEYTEGRPQLISTGIGISYEGIHFDYGAPPGFIGVSANGTDVYFGTFDTLVTQDHNGSSVKIYDARTGGGFPAERTPEKCLAADECHGAGPGAPTLPADRTSAQLGPKAKPKAHKAKKHKKHQKAHKKKSKKRAKATGGKREQGRGNRG
jgi:hypothetical protein